MSCMVSELYSFEKYSYRMISMGRLVGIQVAPCSTLEKN